MVNKKANITIFYATLSSLSFLKRYTIIEKNNYNHVLLVCNRYRCNVL
jgi:hypothetical protein